MPRECLILILCFAWVSCDSALQRYPGDDGQLQSDRVATYKFTPKLVKVSFDEPEREEDFVTFFGSPSRVPGVDGWALGLDGVDDYAVVDSPWPPRSHEVTISFWFRYDGPDSLSMPQALLGNTELHLSGLGNQPQALNGFATSVFFETYRVNRLEFGSSLAVGSSTFRVSDPISSGIWYFFAMRGAIPGIDGDENKGKCDYLGQQGIRASFRTCYFPSSSGVYLLEPGTEKIQIGFAPGYDYLQGAIDDIRLYNWYLTTDELIQIKETTESGLTEM